MTDYVDISRHMLRHWNVTGGMLGQAYVT